MKLNVTEVISNIEAENKAPVPTKAGKIQKKKKKKHAPPASAPEGES